MDIPIITTTITGIPTRVTIMNFASTMSSGNAMRVVDTMNSRNIMKKVNIIPVGIKTPSSKQCNILYPVGPPWWSFQELDGLAGYLLDRVIAECTGTLPVVHTPQDPP